MSDTPNGAGAGAEQPQLTMKVLAQFIRDMSFENILAQKGSQGEVTPEVNVQVQLEPRKRSVENQYEVICKYVVSSKNKGGEGTLFQLELEYGGVFHIEGLSDEQLAPFLMIECPRLLFPFARRIIADITREGGFPPINLDGIDFVQIYRQTLLQRQAEVAAQGQTTPTES